MCFQHKSPTEIQPAPSDTVPTKQVVLPLQSEGELPLLRKGLGHNWDAEVGAKQSARGQQKSNIVFLLLKVSFFQVHYSIKVWVAAISYRQKSTTRRHQGG